MAAVKQRRKLGFDIMKKKESDIIDLVEKS